MGSLLIKLKDFSNNHKGERGITIFFDISKDTPMIVIGIQNRISQVINNLLANAEIFSPPNSRITVRAKIFDGFVNITVDDEGPGFSEYSLINVFDRFYKDRPTEEKFDTHSGLGLSISKQIIETHGGKIWAENRKSSNGNILGGQVKFILPIEI